MQENVKKRWYLIFYIICLIIFLSNIPFSLFINNKILLFILSIIFEMIAIIVLLFQMKKEKLFHEQTPINYKKILQFLPTFLICFSNFLVVYFSKSNNVLNVNLLNLFFKIVITLFNVFLEEILFRYILLHEFEERSGTFKSIFYSSLIFGAMHLLNISSLASIPGCLFQTLYTFGLGVVLGFIYIFSKNIVFPIVLHLLFNIFNDVIVSTFFIIEWNYIFFVVNISISLIMFLYLIFLYKFLTREKKKDAA